MSEPTLADELPKLLDLALAEVRATTRELVERHNLPTPSDFRLDLKTGTLTLGPVTFDVQFAGAYDPSSRHWRWAWADPSLPKYWLLPADHAKAFGDVNEIPEFTNPTVPADEATAWRWTAFAARLIDWPGIYACPLASGVTVFVAFRPQVVGTLGTISVSQGPVTGPSS